MKVILFWKEKIKSINYDDSVYINCIINGQNSNYRIPFEFMKPFGVKLPNKLFSIDL